MPVSSSCHLLNGGLNTDHEPGGSSFRRQHELAGPPAGSVVAPSGKLPRDPLGGTNSEGWMPALQGRRPPSFFLTAFGALSSVRIGEAPYTNIKSACLGPLETPLSYGTPCTARLCEPHTASPRMDGPQWAPVRCGNSERQRSPGEGPPLALWSTGQGLRLGGLSGHSTQRLALKGL